VKELKRRLQYSRCLGDYKESRKIQEEIKACPGELSERMKEKKVAGDYGQVSRYKHDVEVYDLADQICGA